jgi:enoyl-CoA hydratase
MHPAGGGCIPSMHEADQRGGKDAGMEEIRCEQLNQILVVKLARGKANALAAPMVEELNAVIDEAAGDTGIRGVVVASDCPGFFCAGFDIHEVFEYDRNSMTLFSARFIDLYESIYLLPKPVVAAISGHAYAGGAMLAVACDLRIMATEAADFALNEINLGLMLPPGFIRMLVGVVGPGAAREIVLSGNPVGPGRALEIGLVSEVVDLSCIRQRAVELCSSLAKKPGAAFVANKRALREVLGRTVSDSDRVYLQEIIDHWFSPEVEARKQALRKTVSAGSSKE